MNNLRKVLAAITITGAATAMFATAAEATYVNNTSFVKIHSLKPDCALYVSLDEVHATNNVGQRFVNVRSGGTVVCTGQHATTQPEIDLKIDGVVAAASTQTTAVWRNSFGMGRSLSTAPYLWSITNWKPGCHTFQGIFKAWVDGQYGYVTTSTPKTICA